MVRALVFVLTLLLAACGAYGQSRDDGTQSVSAGEQLSIVATTSILGDVAGAVADDAAEVTILMPPGSDPHSFEASAQQLAQMQQADLVIANGGGLEQQLHDALKEAEGAGVPVFHAIDHVDTLAFSGQEEHADERSSAEAHADEEHTGAEEHEGENGAVDPHFWMDPSRMAQVVQALGDEIGGIAGDDGATVSRAGAYAGRLQDLDVQTQDMLSVIPDDQRTLVTNHEAFGYFADRYGFEIVGTLIPGLSTGAEPSAQDLEELLHTIADEQVSAIFTENTTSDRLAETLAQEAGSDVEVVGLYSDSLGDESSSATTYVDMLRTNARRISDTLGG